VTSTDPFGPGAGRATRRGDGDVGMRGQRRGVPVPPRREEVPVGARPDARRGSVGNRDGSPQAAEYAARGLSRSTLWDDADRGEGRFSGPQPLRARWDPVPPPRPRVGRRRVRTERRRSALGWFLHHYGWRAYALPVLAALTVVAVIGVVNSTDPPATEAAGQSGVVTVTMANSVVTTVTIAGPGATTTVGDGAKATQTGAVDPDAIGSGADATQVYAKAKAASSVPPIPAVDPSKAFQGVVMGALPPGNAFAKTGAGTFHVIPGTSEPFGSGADHRTFTVEAEDGVESAAADQQFADAVVAILSGPRSWAAAGGFTLQRIDSGTPDFRVTLTSQMTTRQAGFCGWEVQLEASCYNSAQGRVLINDARWMRGSYSYDGDLVSYRAYAINHEVGHALGYNHEACAVSGGPAPVMMQQSWSTANDDVARLNGGGPVPADGKVCRANPFVVSP
jgi:hypothetical protein